MKVSFALAVLLVAGDEFIDTRAARHKKMSRAFKCDVILADIMEEIEQKFKDYLTGTDAWQYYEDVDYFLREARKFLPKDIQDILITNYPQNDQTMPEDLWMFFEGHCVKVKDFSKVAAEPEIIELRALKSNAKCVRITKQNYSFLQTRQRKEPEPKPMLEISIKLEDDQTLDFKAVEAANCKHLLEIYKKHFAPLFPV